MYACSIGPKGVAAESASNASIEARRFCRFGPNCEFARKGQCFFVHSPQELKYRPPKPIGYPVRSRGSSNYDDYDDFYYGESTENDYYYGNSQYEGHEVSDYDRSGICESERVKKSTNSTEPALIAMELAVQIRDFATTPEHLQLLMQAMTVLAASERADNNGGGVVNAALTLSKSLGPTQDTSASNKTNTDLESNSRLHTTFSLHVDNHSPLPDDVKTNFKTAHEEAGGSAETDLPDGSCAQQ
ncbi:hypothetical protein Pmar_PMAR020694 [Perkinsus marinus ATCC 50983]|uniref:C3H1-type domain-containing protein n=1 Tax=Perkinsus marinus (strain ATCC 50983 / TXsc) TaxID=423536 RepID=C5L7R5_PERM5|nr:hypothetical protein Pmar_PMAR020694 [Perkinsus marinus ATCC 50983]EER07527.1 hypothetical protein Pmar_PMAR020694 [Perkinsus marinus ATCC 50983]|eukprot:XP_002775711.1 hypothetical protein Pmar_PMAR020694 [Perkinsus marinus ATCC 50983]